VAVGTRRGRRGCWLHGDLLNAVYGPIVTRLESPVKGRMEVCAPPPGPTG
jgi:hypothetical protein